MVHTGSCFDLCHQEFSLFASESFIVSDPTFRSLIHFEFIFVYGVAAAGAKSLQSCLTLCIRKCFNFIFLHVAIQFSQYHLLKRLSLPHSIFFPPLSKASYP